MSNNAEPDGVEQQRTVTGQLTVVETAYHTSLRGVAQSVDSAFSVNLSTDDPPYVRPMLEVGESPVLLDVGWVKEPLMFVVENPHESRAVNPTATQVSDDAARVVEVSLSKHMGGTVLLVPPGGSQRCMADDHSKVTLRCRRGTARVTITVFPK